MSEGVLYTEKRDVKPCFAAFKIAGLVDIGRLLVEKKGTPKEDS